MINVVKDFNPRPVGRDDGDGPYNGEVFRKTILKPAMDEGCSVVVDLTGYNRYGPSFIDEAFAGLIRDGFSFDDLEQRLQIRHDHQELPVKLAWIRIKDATEE